MGTIISTAALALALTLSSPDGRLQVNFSSSPATYTVVYDGETMISPSHLGLVADYADYSELEFIDSQTQTVSDCYSIDRIKTSKVDHPATRSLLHFRTSAGHYLDMEWHITDNDVAFRYLLTRDGGRGSVRVLREMTSFNFPSGTTTYLCPQSKAMIGWKRSKPSYEEKYRPGALMEEKSEYGEGFTFPCLFRIAGEGWALVSETGVDGRYCGSHLSDYDPAKGYGIAFAMAEENNGNGTVEPAFALPGSTPWRTITVGRDLAPIAETTVAFDVVEPKYESAHVYDYGKSTWSWILWQDDSINYDDQVRFIDLAAAMGFKYTLVDAGWDTNIGRSRIEELVEYAKSKGIGIFLWYSSSGWWNDITQSPIDIMSEPIPRKAEMNWLQKIGVKGIKVDFFGGDKQETMRHYENILSDADDHGLMVIFHGCTLPRGWERLYPNYVGSEAVLASENLIFSQASCDEEALNACLHPFIRNTVGCMEFGGTFLNRYMHKDNGKPDAGGKVRGNLRRTTDAFELATAVLFQNPIQNFALAPGNLTDAPATALDFLREVPATWDETRLVDGFPGKYAVLARRHADTWYIGAVNADEKPLMLDVKAIAERFGGTAQVIATSRGDLIRLTANKKPLAIPKNDGAVIILK